MIKPINNAMTTPKAMKVAPKQVEKFEAPAKAPAKEAPAKKGNVAMQHLDNVGKQMQAIMNVKVGKPAMDKAEATPAKEK